MSDVAPCASVTRATPSSLKVAVTRLNWGIGRVVTLRYPSATFDVFNCTRALLLTCDGHLPADGGLHATACFRIRLNQASAQNIETVGSCVYTHTPAA